MFPEIFLGFGRVTDSGKMLSRLVIKILARKKPFYQHYFLNFPLGKESHLIKDHTNLLFSYIRYLRITRSDSDLDNLKELIRIISSEFVSENIIFNRKSDLGKKASALAFSFLEIVLECYLLTDDHHYLETLDALLPYWLKTLERFGVFPVYIDTLNNQRSADASVDPNTDFYVFLKKARLFLGETYISDNLLNRFKKNIMESFINPKTLDVYSRINLDTGGKFPMIKCKFSTLFTKIMIADQIKNQRDFQSKEIYLDDR